MFLQLATLHSDHPAFARAKLAGAYEFSVKHYAGEVLYHAEGFLDKNKDTVGEACRDLLAQSSVPLVSDGPRPVILQSGMDLLFLNVTVRWNYEMILLRPSMRVYDWH